MVIVFVVDIYCDPKNGTSITAHRFVEGLRKQGHEVRVLAVGDPSADNYFVKAANYGFISRIGDSQGFTFAQFNESTVIRALRGADIVHFLLPLPFEWRVLRLVKEMGIPYSAAYHLQPENFTYIVHIEKIPGMNFAVYKGLYYAFFRQFRHIHCPSQFIANELERHKYKGKFYVISNGIEDHFRLPEKPRDPDPDLFRILMTGRISPEKNQHMLIDAVKLSRHRDNIQIYYAGDGPCKEKLIMDGDSLRHPPIIRFYSQPELVDLLHHMDLYVHTSVVEIEAISCLEAIATGLVPVICKSNMTATVQFAKDERSLYRDGSAQDLADKIDYWIEHPEERMKASLEYAESAHTYRLADSIQKIEFMFRETIEDFQQKG